MGEIKIWLKDKLQTIGSDVKGIKADFEVLDERLLRIEGNLKLEWTVDKLQAETINTKQTITGVEERVWKLEGSVKYLQEDVEDFRMYDELERRVESLDNSQRKTNLKVRGLK